MKTCVLFDLDGTLLDTLEDLTDGVNYALSRFGLPERTVGEIRGFVGNGVASLIQKASGNAPNWEEILGVYRAYYETHCQIKTRPYPGVAAVLAELADQYPVGVVSNKQDAAVKPMCRDYFGNIYALGETPDCPRKPAPDMLYRAMEALGAHRCVYVGDSEVDVQTALNGNLPCISVLWGFRDEAVLRQAGGRYFCGDAEELPALIEQAVEEYYGK